MGNYLIVYGTARLVDGGAPQLLQRLAEVYLGPGVTFPPMENPPPGHVIHVTPSVWAVSALAGLGKWHRSGWAFLHRSGTTCVTCESGSLTDGRLSTRAV